MADQQHVVVNLNDLTPAGQARAWQIPDFLERLPARRPTYRADDLYERVYVAFGENRTDPLGRISVYPQRLLPYRDPDSGGAKLLSATLVEFPTTAFMAPDVWDLLFEATLAQVPTVAVYLPPECRRHVDYLHGLGFKRYADDYDSTRSLYLRHGPASDRMPVYPILPGTNLMRTANASSALMPETEAWAAVENYSGFSGYAWLTPLLDSLLGSPTRLLSMPAGTGDVLRLLPERLLHTVEECVGIDILGRNIEFAQARAARPHVDTLNMLVCTAFLEAGVTGDPAPALALVRQVCARAGRPIGYDAARDLYIELRAVADEALTCGGIADWFALTKAIGRFVGGPDTRLPSVALADAIGPDGVQTLAARHGGLPDPESFAQLRDRGGVAFDTADMFAYRSARPFDTIFVWEAMLIVAAAGRQREYVEMIDANLAPGGTVVLTGIRRDDGRPGRDLEILVAEFRRNGYATVVTDASPPTDRWARGLLPQPVFPVLIATKTCP
ncbi:hypothetical protein EV385_5985 [Krasilnikovia cinnamomea]|uniref:Methyltransferase family protein n=1 Tax=Krasilnikovia cinnamomea TaxID=349313 RepID=A0A4Q7ZS94_9ACTN|nr:hypothetical protein [Krasilnikovia cinnamomea]RZU54048.1 hypothetical protein EV385_5985 [Krasilnikovia cinnamomea]